MDLAALCTLAVLTTAVVDGARHSIDIHDLPPPQQYTRDPGHTMSKYVLGEAVVMSPRECGELCDVTPRCMGFNYLPNKARCSMTTHNKFTNPMLERYRENNSYDHYIRLDAKYQCPDGSFPHPYKARCYQVMNEPKTFLEASKTCRQMDGQLAIIPNRLTKHAIWDQVVNSLEGDSVFLGIEFKRRRASLRRRGQKAPYMWNSNLVRGLPDDGRNYCGVASVSSGGKFDYTSCTTPKPYLCEFRSHYDTELNELCPHDTALFDGNCFWSSDSQLPAQVAADHCADRGGILAAFPSVEALDFIGNVWEHIVPGSIPEASIGLEWKQNEGRWYWSDGNPDTYAAKWQSGAERAQGETESCGTAVRSSPGAELAWMSRDCDESHAYICMGPSGVVMSNDCPTKNCPANSICNEGPFEASCECEPGYVSSLVEGRLKCQSSHVCQASGDPHYSIWDGGRVHYQGLCTHLLAGPCGGTPPPGYPDYQVHVYNTQRAGYSDRVAFTEYTEVHVYGQVVRMGLDMLVMVNGYARTPEVTLYPYNDDRYITVIAKPAGNNLQLVTDFGLQVDYKLYRVTIVCPDQYRNAMCGICGNFNGDPYDEDIEHNQQQWTIVQDSDGPHCQVDDPYINIASMCDPLQRAQAEERCGVIHTMSLLDHCRRAEGVELSPYYDDCVEDACAGAIEDIDSVVCMTLEAVNLYCNDRGFPIPAAYRAVADCPLECQENSEYQPEMSYDIPTCQNPDALYEISLGRGEGCACIAGYVMDAGRCVPRDQCGCMYGEQELYIELGDTVVNEDCTIMYRCEQGGEITEMTLTCGRQAQCSIDDKGVRGCHCIIDHVGNPLDICHHRDACPYPMPEPAQYSQHPAAYSLDVAGLGSVGAQQLATNGARVDMDTPNTLYYMQPGSTLLNPHCQVVTCYAGDDWDESPTQCVAHARCEHVTDVADNQPQTLEGVPKVEATGYRCVCESEKGYTGDGYTACLDDTSSTGDPHFMMTSHNTGERLCFDVHGSEGQVWRLLEDRRTGLVVNGGLFQVNSTLTDQPKSYFSNISILAGHDVILFNRQAIYYNEVAPHQWGDNIHLGPLHYVSHDLYEVRVTDDVTLRVSRASSPVIGEYLGIYVTNSDGLDEGSTGLIGRFIKSEFYVERSNTEDAPEGTLIFTDGHTSVPVTQVHRYNRAHHGQVSCWLYQTHSTPSSASGGGDHASEGVDALIGDQHHYAVADLFDF